MLGVIQRVVEVHDFKIEPVASLEGKGGRLGMAQMMKSMFGYSSMDGYKVETDKHTFYVLIDNERSCC